MIYFILITPKFFFKLGQKKVPSSGEKRWYTSLMYFCTLNWFGAKLWSQIPTGWNISGTAGSIREVKPACVRPNVKEFKHWFFFFFSIWLQSWQVWGTKGTEGTCSFQPSSDGQNSFWILTPVSSKTRQEGIAWNCRLFLSFHSPSCVFVPTLFSCSYSLPQISSCKHPEHCVPFSLVQAPMWFWFCFFPFSSEPHFFLFLLPLPLFFFPNPWQ